MVLVPFQIELHNQVNGLLFVRLVFIILPPTGVNVSMGVFIWTRMIPKVNAPLFKCHITWRNIVSTSARKHKNVRKSLLEQLSFIWDQPKMVAVVRWLPFNTSAHVIGSFWISTQPRLSYRKRGCAHFRNDIISVYFYLPCWDFFFAEQLSCRAHHWH